MRTLTIYLESKPLASGYNMASVKSFNVTERLYTVKR